MAHKSYEESIKAVYKGLILLAFLTVIEVIFSLLGKGYIIEGVEQYKWLITGVSVIILVLSVYKAYFIIYEFMHMKYEMPGLAKTVLLPMGLLVWAIIAFFSEGKYWNYSRNHIKDLNKQSIEKENSQIGMDVRILKKEDFQ